MIVIGQGRTADEGTWPDVEWDPSAEVRGRSIGLMFMTFFGAGWILAGVGVSGIDNPARLVIQVADLLVTAGLLAVGVWLFIDGGRLPKSANPVVEERRRLSGRLFGLIFGAEIVIILGVSQILSMLSLERFVLPAVAVVVGVHFLPLAAVFRIRAYFMTGYFLTLLGVFGLVGILVTGAQDLWGAGVAFSVGLVLWVTAMVIGSQARRLYAPSDSRP